jgi:GTP cyclohydrolase FolE2
VRATGLTFAPEAGTQRMRDVVNKNVTEEQLMETAERVFSRGWAKMKLYFMIGLPTERTRTSAASSRPAARARVGAARQKGKPAEVTVSVSTTCPSRTRPSSGARWTARRSSQAAPWLRDEAAGAQRVDLKLHETTGAPCSRACSRAAIARSPT